MALLRMCAVVLCALHVYSANPNDPPTLRQSFIPHTQVYRAFIQKHP